jgi:hypothetical protein
MSLNPRTKIVEKKGTEFHVDGDYVLLHNSHTNESMKLSPAEVPRLTKLLSSVGSLVSFKSLPPNIFDPPFTVNFTPTGQCLLTRGSEDSGLTFSMDDVDGLIEGLNMSLQKVNDLKVIRGGPAPGAPAFVTPEPIFEGRE